MKKAQDKPLRYGEGAQVHPHHCSHGSAGRQGDHVASGHERLTEPNLLSCFNQLEDLTKMYQTSFRMSPSITLTEQEKITEREQ